MYNKGLVNEAEKLSGLVKQFWKGKATGITYQILEESPYHEFVLYATLYNRFRVKMEYENSTLGIGVDVGGQFKILSKMTERLVYRGLKSYTPTNLLHNFRVLDEVLLKSQEDG